MLHKIIMFNIVPNDNNYVTYNTYDIHNTKEREALRYANPPALSCLFGEYSQSFIQFNTLLVFVCEYFAQHKYSNKHTNNKHCNDCSQVEYHTRTKSQRAFRAHQKSTEIIYCMNSRATKNILGFYQTKRKQSPR